jgi:hypothetical protein
MKTVSLREIYSRNGRINNKKITELVNSVSKSQFISMIPHPMLVSRKLYEGNLQQHGSTNTMVFSVKAIREQIAKKENLEDTVSDMTEDDTFVSSIFALVKNRDSYNSQNVFTIGRVLPNDIVIPDFTISKIHASIKFIDNSYQCFDLGSTNGTLVANRLLKANESVILSPCDFITLGRLGFVFMPNEKLYDLLKR